MNFRLYVSLNNAAFADGNEGAELARILRAIADRIQNDGFAPRYFQNVYDINGDIAGSYAAKPADYVWSFQKNAS